MVNPHLHNAANSVLAMARGRGADGGGAGGGGDDPVRFQPSSRTTLDRTKAYMCVGGCGSSSLRNPYQMPEDEVFQVDQVRQYVAEAEADPLADVEADGAAGAAPLDLEAGYEGEEQGAHAGADGALAAAFGLEFADGHQLPHLL
eukprot:tig00001208_g7530.t1